MKRWSQRQWGREVLAFATFMAVLSAVMSSYAAGFDVAGSDAIGSDVAEPAVAGAAAVEAYSMGAHSSHVLRSVICKQFADDGFTTLKSFRLLRRSGYKVPHVALHDARLKIEGRKKISGVLTIKNSGYEAAYNKSKGAYKHSYSWSFHMLRPADTPYIFIGVAATPFWSGTHEGRPHRGVYTGQVKVHTSSCALCQDLQVYEFNRQDCMIQIALPSA